MKTSLVIFVLFTWAICGAEEIETRKTVKKSAAVDSKSVAALKAEEPELQTIAVETVKETTLTASSAAATKPTTIAPLSTTSPQVPEALMSSSSTAKPPMTATESFEEPNSSEEIAAINFPSSMITESKPEPSSTSESSFEIPDDDDDLDAINSSSEISNAIPLGQNSPKRKVVYINQQQNGKMNVQLELSDVSVIVIPNNQRDPQLSLLSLLFKSAQKSNEVKKKEENELNDQYSKYKLPVRAAEESYNMPLVESRAPYKVDISSTMGQQLQPAVDITPNGHQHSMQQQQQFQPQFARSPIMQLLKPIPFTIHPAPGQLPQSNRIFKRSLGSRMLILDDDVPVDGENSVNEELTESIFNTFDDNDDLNNSYDESDRSEFVLLGATENCGPGRKRNSYQICVSDPDWEAAQGWE